MIQKKRIQIEPHLLEDSQKEFEKFERITISHKNKFICFILQTKL
jgi:hypothetical protein